MLRVLFATIFSLLLTVPALPAKAESQPSSCVLYSIGEVSGASLTLYKNGIVENLPVMTWPQSFTVSQDGNKILFAYRDFKGAYTQVLDLEKGIYAKHYAKDFHKLPEITGFTQVAYAPDSETYAAVVLQNSGRAVIVSNGKWGSSKIFERSMSYFFDDLRWKDINTVALRIGVSPSPNWGHITIDVNSGVATAITKDAFEEIPPADYAEPAPVENVLKSISCKPFKG
ncbi:MAG: hypothetical protein QG639_172 [Patescibacteria group bacterium]|nr:hypothetical protein [Patescibacteria group bacterium]